MKKRWEKSTSFQRFIYQLWLEFYLVLHNTMMGLHQLMKHCMMYVEYKKIKVGKCCPKQTKLPCKLARCFENKQFLSCNLCLNGDGNCSSCCSLSPVLGNLVDLNTALDLQSILWKHRYIISFLASSSIFIWLSFPLGTWCFKKRFLEVPRWLVRTVIDYWTATVTRVPWNWTLLGRIFFPRGP